MPPKKAFFLENFLLFEIYELTGPECQFNTFVD